MRPISETDKAYCRYCGHREVPQHDDFCVVAIYAARGEIRAKVKTKRRDTPDMEIADQWLLLTRQLEARGGLDPDVEISDYLDRAALDGGEEEIEVSGRTEELLRDYPQSAEAILRARKDLRAAQRNAEEGFNDLRKILKKRVDKMQEQAEALQADIERLRWHVSQ